MQTITDYRLTEPDKLGLVAVYGWTGSAVVPVTGYIEPLYAKLCKDILNMAAEQGR